MCINLSFVKFLVLLFIFYEFYVSSCAVDAASVIDGQGNTAVAVFVPNSTKFSIMLTDKRSETTFHFFFLPFISGSDEIMIAFAVGSFVFNSEKLGIVARYIATDGGNDWKERILNGNGVNWNGQVIFQTDARKQNGILEALKGPLVLMKDNKIYLLLSRCGMSQEINDLQKISNSFDFFLVVGEISDSSGTKTIRWQEPISLEDTVSRPLKEQLLYLNPLIKNTDYAFFTEDGNIVFVVETSSTSGELIPILIYSDVQRTQFLLSSMKSDLSCSFFFFPWGKKIMRLLPCSFPGQKLEESDDMGKNWKPVEGEMSRLWEFFLPSEGFISFTINNLTTLLFMQVSERTSSIKLAHAALYDIYLWMTEGNRRLNVGLIYSGVSGSNTGRLLYTKGELFSLRNVISEGVPKEIVLTHLKKQTEKVNFVINAWSRTDAHLSRPCNGTTTKNVSSAGSICVTPVPTGGLVVFLANRTLYGNRDWIDEYFFVNATVRGGAKVENGFLFDGVGAGAKLPMGIKGRNEVYDFLTYGFSLVASIIIHTVPKNSSSPLMGVVLKSPAKEIKNMMFGLLYSNDKKWKFMKNLKVKQLSEVEWELKKEYSVAFVFSKGRCSVLVDWESVGSEQSCDIKENKGILHFFLAANIHNDMSKNDRYSHLTVTNVFLYNRPFAENEIYELKSRREFYMRTLYRTSNPVSAYAGMSFLPFHLFIFLFVLCVSLCHFV